MEVENNRALGIAVGGDGTVYVAGSTKSVAFPTTTGAVQTVSDTVDDESPSFAPNGKLIIYATRAGGRDVLMTTTLDGRIKARLVSTSADVREPTWGPFIK